MRFKGLFSLMTVLLLFSVGFVAAWDESVTDSENTDFSLPWGREVTSAQLSGFVENPVEVFLNDISQGTFDGTDMIINEGDFIGYFNGRAWKSDNRITFSPEEDLNSFDLGYDVAWLSSSDGSEGDVCEDNDDCDGSCYYGYCCDHTTNDDPPIKFKARIDSACKDSKIPIQLITEGCGNSLSDVAVHFYLNGQRYDELNDSPKALEGQEVICTINGGTGWDLLGEIRCGTRPVNLAPGDYRLTAEYSIGNKDFEVEIEPDFTIDTVESCNAAWTNTRCSHAGSTTHESTGLDRVTYTLTEFPGGERREIGGIHYLPANGSGVKIGGIASVRTQCSNSVPYYIIPGFVAWIDGARRTVRDSLTGCDVVTTDRADIFERNEGKGHKSPDCRLSLVRSNPDEFVLSNFGLGDAGSYEIKLDMINAICDSPSYICPDSDKDLSRDGICGIGTMSISDPKGSVYRQDGWNANLAGGYDEPLRTYQIKAVLPNITAEFLSASQINQEIQAIYELTAEPNSGSVKVTVPSSSVYGDFRHVIEDTDSIVIHEGEPVTTTVSIVPAKTEEDTDLSYISEEADDFEVSRTNFSDYGVRNISSNEINLSYAAFTSSLDYDDNYNFNLIQPQSIPLNWDFDLNLKCDGNNKFILGFDDYDYYCTCNDGKFFSVAKGASEIDWTDFITVTEEDGICPKEDAVELLSPHCGDYLPKGTKKSIYWFSDGPSNVTINGQVLYETDMRGINKYDYDFMEEGNFMIIVYFIDSNGKTRRDISNIAVIDMDVGAEGKYVTACIDEPQDLSDVPSGRNVLFNASSTRGYIKSAGDVTPDEVDKDNINFYWKFSSGNNPYVSGSNPLSHLFRKNFQTPGNNWATLDVELITN